MPTSSDLSLRDLQERERWVALIDTLLAMCASEMRMADDLRDAREQRQIDLREEAKRRASEDLARFFRKAS